MNLAEKVKKLEKDIAELNKLIISLRASGGGTHAILSSKHSDTVIAAVVRGDIITGQATPPFWTRLALGSSGYFLKSGATDVGWDEITQADVDGLHDDQSPTFAGLVVTGDVAFEDILLEAGSYINWGVTRGSSGYGFRDNSGSIEVKHSGGTGWAAVRHITVDDNGPSGGTDGDIWIEW